MQMPARHGSSRAIDAVSQAGAPRGTSGARTCAGVDRRSAVVAVAALPWVGGCASLADMTRLFVGVDDLIAMLERQFPRRERFHDVIDVVLTHPRLRLVPQRNRLATELEVAATERLQGRSAKGSLALEYGLRYESSDASVRLAQVQVQSLRMDDAARAIGALQPIGRVLIEKLLEDMSITKLSAQRADALRRLSLTRAALTVTDRGLDIRFASAAR